MKKLAVAMKPYSLRPVPSLMILDDKAVND